MVYAKETKVDVETSQFEIQKLLQKYGATKFGIDWNELTIIFEIHQRKIKIKITPPQPSDRNIQFTPQRRKRTPDQIISALAQAKRQRWRALLLVIKAKLEAIEAGISTIDNEFLPYFILRNGQTLADHILPQLDQPDLFPTLPKLLKDSGE
jgi:hypothetical protein